ncbi:MAG: bifunctional diaminohydroxyphosphoribosylaminopyrimidine deaminase/5-amino-6-(5-phosphoribosylamino)uracil reductase RibD [Terriglobales bacterium]
MTTHALDDKFMARALELARKGIALASPNPHVGAVVVNGAGDVVGEGAHIYEERKHAEAVALEKAGEKARGATLYLNLEPCCHTGRTGPCADLVIAAGIRRVVSAMSDPNPLVSGKGLERLRAAGIEVTTGVREQEARKLNEAFAKWIHTHEPLVTLKAAMTLDGRIAPAPMDSRAPSGTQVPRGWITSADARAHVQELRHASDAIMVGVGTIIADDPLLTDRTGRPRRRPLQRVVLDSRLRIPLDSKIIESAHGDVVIFCSFADTGRRRELEQRGIRIEQVRHTGMASRPDLREVVRRLGEMEITSLMIEGGAMVNWTAMVAGIPDKVFFYYAPRILGGSQAVPYAAGMGYKRVQDAPHVQCLTLHRFGEDFAVEGYLRDPYASGDPAIG